MRDGVHLTQPLEQFEPVARLGHVRTERDRPVVLHEGARAASGQGGDHVGRQLFGPERGVARGAWGTPEREHVVVQGRKLVAGA